MAKATIRQQVDRLLRGRKRDESTGLIYSKASQKKGRWNAISLHAIFVSDENTYLVREHVFRSSELRSAKEWEAWLSDNYNAHDETAIMRRILAGMANRTGKFWRLWRVIGWTPNVNPRLADSKARTPRNKTKR